MDLLDAICNAILRDKEEKTQITWAIFCICVNSMLGLEAETFASRF